MEYCGRLSIHRRTSDMPSSKVDRYKARTVFLALSDVISCHLHEINNKIGSILLHAEALAERCPPDSPAGDILRDTRQLLQLAGDLGGILPRKRQDGKDVPLAGILELAGRLSRGSLRRKRLKLVLPELGDRLLLGQDLFPTLSNMLLVPTVFPRPPHGEEGTIRVEIQEDRRRRLWILEMEPRMELDAAALESVAELCRWHDWVLESSPGRLSIDVSRVEGSA